MIRGKQRSATHVNRSSFLPSIPFVKMKCPFGEGPRLPHFTSYVLVDCYVQKWENCRPFRENWAFEMFLLGDSSGSPFSMAGSHWTPPQGGPETPPPPVAKTCGPRHAPTRAALPRYFERWDFPWNKPSSDKGVPPWLGKPPNVKEYIYYLLNTCILAELEWFNELKIGETCARLGVTPRISFPSSRSSVLPCYSNHVYYISVYDHDIPIEETIEWLFPFFIQPDHIPVDDIDCYFLDTSTFMVD